MVAIARSDKCLFLSNQFVIFHFSLSRFSGVPTTFAMDPAMLIHLLCVNGNQTGQMTVTQNMDFVQKNMMALVVIGRKTENSKIV